MAAAKPEVQTRTVTPEQLRRLAGAAGFQRGEGYFATDAVRTLRREANGVRARVQGTHLYRVRLWWDGDELDFTCSCPVGLDGAFCKHCVAAGLAWHADEAGDPEKAGTGKAATTAEPDIETFLMRLDKTELVAMLLEQVDEDERLERRLRVRAARSAGGAPDLSVWKAALDSAVAVDDYVSYREAHDYAAGIEDVIDNLEDLLREGQAESVMRLAEHGVGSVEEAMQYADDSDGWLGGCLYRLQELHLQACERARPDPEDLAERLFDLEIESDFDTFYGAAATYADILGPAGRAAYRRLAEAAWAELPELVPGDDNPDRYGRRRIITNIMTTLTEESGDLDALVAIKSRDLSTANDFLDIAQLYDRAGDHDQALDWAERGFRAFPDVPHWQGLLTFIADEYQRRGRHDDALALVWRAFDIDPSLRTYQQLNEYADRAGSWPDWRDKALSASRDRIAAAAPVPRGTWRRGAFRDHSLLVEIFLAEGDAEAAWREAEAGGCDDRLWLELAKARERSHPDDAVRVYRARVDRLLRNPVGHTYEEPVGLLAGIEGLLVNSGKPAAFADLIAEIRDTHRRKRNLMRALDDKGW